MKTIYWAGDSTCAYNSIKTWPQTGIGQVFGLYLKEGYTVCNLAKNGASSKSFYDSGRLKPAVTGMEEGDYLFIQFGHNDEKAKADRHTDPFTTYQEYLLRYVEAARSKGAKPVLITPLYRRHFDGAGRLKDGVHLDYPDAVTALAERAGLPCVDLCGRSKELIGRTGDEGSRKWFMHLTAGQYANYPAEKKDDTHLHYEGAVVMAGLVAEGLCALGGEYAAMLLD